MWHVWVKAYRAKHGLTQEQAASALCVEARTIQRWESGKFEPSREQWGRLYDVLVPSRVHRLTMSVRSLIDMTSDIMVAFDEDFRVLAQSRSHMRLCHELHGREDMSGIMWLDKYAPENIVKTVTSAGGGRGMFKSGLVSMRGAYIQESSSGSVLNAGRTDATFLRLHDGNVIVTVMHRDMSDDFVHNYVRPNVAALTPDGVTMLDS